MARVTKWLEKNPFYSTAEWSSVSRNCDLSLHCSNFVNRNKYSFIALCVLHQFDAVNPASLMVNKKFWVIFS